MAVSKPSQNEGTPPRTTAEAPICVSITTLGRGSQKKGFDEHADNIGQPPAAQPARARCGIKYHPLPERAARVRSARLLLGWWSSASGRGELPEAVFQALMASAGLRP